MHGRIPPQAPAPTVSLTFDELERKGNRKSPTDGVKLTVVRGGEEAEEKLLIVKAEVIDGDKGDNWICAAQQAVKCIEDIDTHHVSRRIEDAKKCLRSHGIELFIEQPLKYGKYRQTYLDSHLISFNPSNHLKYFTWFAINKLHSTEKYKKKIENILAFCEQVYKKKEGQPISKKPRDVINHYLPEFRDEIIITKTVTRIVLPHHITSDKKTVKVIRQMPSSEDSHIIRLFDEANLFLQKQIIDEEKQQAVWFCTLTKDFLRKLFDYDITNVISELKKDKILPQTGSVCFVKAKNDSRPINRVTRHYPYTDQDCFTIFDALINLKNSGKKRKTLNFDKISVIATRLRDILLERDPSAPLDNPEDSIQVRAQKWRWTKIVTNKQLIGITSDKVTLTPHMDLSTDHDESKHDQVHSHSAASSSSTSATQFATVIQSQAPLACSVGTETKASPVPDSSAMATFACAFSSHTFSSAVNCTQDAYIHSVVNTEKDKLFQTRSCFFSAKRPHDTSSVQSPTSTKRPRLEEQLPLITKTESSDDDFVNSLFL